MRSSIIIGRNNQYNSLASISHSLSQSDTHISTYTTNVLHWLPIASRMKFKVPLFLSKSQLGLAPSYLNDFMRKPMSSTSARPLQSTDRLDLLAPRVRTALAQCRAFAVTGPSSWRDESQRLPHVHVGHYELSSCPVFPQHLVVLLRHFFSIWNFLAESTS